MPGHPRDATSPIPTTTLHCHLAIFRGCCIFRTLPFHTAPAMATTSTDSITSIIPPEPRDILIRTISTSISRLLPDYSEEAVCELQNNGKETLPDPRPTDGPRYPRPAEASSPWETRDEDIITHHETERREELLGSRPLLEPISRANRDIGNSQRAPRSQPVTASTTS